MKTKSLMIAVALFALVMGMTASAYAVTIKPVISTDATGKVPLTKIFPGSRFFVLVQIDDATGVAGAALTLSYNKDLFDVIKQVPTVNGVAQPGVPIAEGEIPRTDAVLESDSFGLFYDNRTGAATPQDWLRVAKLDIANGKIMMSAVSIDSTTGGAIVPTPTTVKNLFRIRFRAKSTLPSGMTFPQTGDFTLSDTMLNNSAAGWTGQAVPALVGAVVKTDSKFSDLTQAFPAISYTYATAASVTVGGTIGIFNPGNTSGKPNVFDVLAALRYVNKVQTPSYVLPGNLDFTHDGTINVFDILYFLRYVNKDPNVVTNGLE